MKWVVARWHVNCRSLAQGAELAALVLVFALSGTAEGLRQPAVSIENATPANYQSSDLLVKFKKPVRKNVKNGNTNDTGVKSVSSILKKNGAYRFQQIARSSKKARTDSELFGWYVVSLNPNRPSSKAVKNGAVIYPDLETLEQELKSDPNVESVSKNYTVSLQAIPNDPYYSSSGAWGQAFDDLWGLKTIDAATAWDTTTGTGSPTVAVVDTGTDRTHADIAGNIWTNPGEVVGNGIDDDSNGYIDDIYGWNWCSNNNNIVDDHGHGTHVAGTIASVGNNGAGVVGVSWSTKLMTAKIFCANGTTTYAAIAGALQYAADNGARISSNSWSGDAADNTVVNDGIRYEYERNVIPIVGAGNNGADALNYSPGAVDGSITVGATDRNDAIASFSNRGMRIDVVAPGVDILSLKSAFAATTCTGAAIVNSTYCVISGTSMATPHVSGLVALMLSVNPSLNTEQVRQILRTTALDLGGVGRDYVFGSGRINAAAAVSASATPTVLTPYISNMRSRQIIGGSVPIKGSANGATFASYKVEVGLGRSPATWFTIGSSSTPVTNGTLANFNTTSFLNSTYIIRLTTTDLGGKTYEHSVYDVTTITDATAPSAPINLTSSNITATSQRINWSAATDNTFVAGYEVYREGTLIATTPEIYYNDTGLSPATSYSYTVKAYDTSGNKSAASAMLYSSTLTDTTAPSVPTGLNVSNSTASSQRINWDTATDDVAVTGYEIYRNTILMGTSASTYFDDTNLTPSTAYTYSIKAFDAAGNISAASADLVASTAADTTPPDAPGGLQLTNITIHSQRLSWNATSDNIGTTSYQVYRDGAFIATTTDLFIDNTSLRPNTLYSYTVRALDAAGNVSADSATISANTSPDTTPPTVTIISPQDAVTVVGTVALNTTTADNDSIALFEIFIDATKIYTNTTALASYSLVTPSYTDGTHTIRVTATDASGNVTNTTITITIDNIPPPRRGDVNGDYEVNIFDLSLLLSRWNTSNATSDLDNNGIVNIFDLSILLYEFGK